MKEREAALALIERHALGDGFVAEFDALRRTFERELTREQKLAGAGARPPPTCSTRSAAAPCWRSCWPRVRSTRAAMRSCAR